MASTKEQRISALGTSIISALILILLVFVTFINEPNKEEEGVLINFGDSEQGMGEIEPRPAIAQTVPEPPTPVQPAEPEPEPTKGEEEVINQDFEESAVIEQKKKEEKRKKEIEEEQKRQQELEQKRIQEELQRQEEERKRQEEQQRKQQQQQQQINSKAANAFAGRNVNGGNSGEGVTGQPGNQGALNGDINSKNRIGGGGGNGINFSLTGRSFGSTPPKPEYNSKSEGKVVVEIRVNRNGDVIGAQPGKAGTTTNDPILREAAKNAALKAKFNSDPNAAEIQVGTITYTFIQQ